MRGMLLIIALCVLGMFAADVQAQFPGYGYPPTGSEGLDNWREKRAQNFWNRTSPSFGDPYYDPLKTSPLSPFRSPQYHPWRTSPFRGDPYYDPYAPRMDRSYGRYPFERNERYDRLNRSPWRR